MSTPLNVGPKSAAWLRQVGVRTREDLVEMGAVAAYVKCKRAGFRPSLNMLYSLEGVLMGCHWQKVPEARRTELLAEAEAQIAQIPPPRGRAAALVVSEVRDVPGDGGDAPAMEYGFGFDDPSASSGGEES
ncbi:TfoX/Sxy family protein [Xanthomonadaceae bacterium JHOS43]|nr:TfoX/Sxy family protein [Xanthomonadaceae bacterium JHOS43]MCX7562201.1 TfoX/Sxy family protein [Xanthomonadaceae bacterium XH05]